MHKYIVVVLHTQPLVSQIFFPRIKCSKSSSVRTSYTFRNVYFMDELMPASSNGSVVVRAPDGSPVPAHMHILRHLRRSTNYTKPGAYIKSFVKTDLVVAMHNHFPFR